MVISFEEKDRAKIEANGVMVIEFKRAIHKMYKEIDKVGKELEKITDRLIKAWKTFADRFLQAMDDVRMAIEVVRDAYHYPTTRRYNIVKVFSKFTGKNIYFWWKVTYRINSRIKRWRQIIAKVP